MKKKSKPDIKPDKMRKFSSVVVEGDDRAPNRSMLRAVGFRDRDFKKPIIGIASTWSMVTPCNMHIDKLALEAGRGADKAGGKSIIFNTITVSDGISMGTPGMRYSLVSREDIRFKAFMTAVNSIRLLVVYLSLPDIVIFLVLYNKMAAHAPGPGFPEHPPSV